MFLITTKIGYYNEKATIKRPVKKLNDSKLL